VPSPAPAPAPVSGGLGLGLGLVIGQTGLPNLVGSFGGGKHIGLVGEGNFEEGPLSQIQDKQSKDPFMNEEIFAKQGGHIEHFDTGGSTSSSGSTTALQTLSPTFGTSKQVSLSPMGSFNPGQEQQFQEIINPYQIQYNAKEGGSILNFGTGGNDGLDEEVPNVSGSMEGTHIQQLNPTFGHSHTSLLAPFTSNIPHPHIGLTSWQAHAEGGEVEGHHPEFYSQGGLNAVDHSNTYVTGKGDGTSDSIPAMLANGEFVFPADVVSGLGNGSNQAGAKVLDQFMQEVRKHKRDAAPNKLPPDSKGPLEYLAQAHKKLGGGV